MNKQKIISFGEHIRELREKAELPIRKVAAQLDIDPSLLGKIERNERQPSKDVIFGIAKIFKQDKKNLFQEYLSDQIAYKIIGSTTICVGIPFVKTAMFLYSIYLQGFQAVTLNESHKHLFNI